MVPRDYALILSRGVLIPTTTGNRDLAARFLDYLLSERGQRVAREQAFFFSEKSPLPDGVDGPAALMESGIGRPIRVGPSLLAAHPARALHSRLGELDRQTVALNSLCLKNKVSGGYTN